MAIADNLGYVKLGMAAGWCCVWCRRQQSLVARPSHHRLRYRVFFGQLLGRLTDKHTSVPHLILTEHKGLSP